MQFTRLVDTFDDGRRHCRTCQWYCTLAEGEVGRCQMRINGPDGLLALHHGMISGAQIGPIEEFRLWHVLPGTNVLAIGSFGYAFPTEQQRGHFAQIPEDPNKRRRLEPDKAAAFALDRLCRGVVWAYGDPSVSHEYVLDLLRVSRASSRYTGLVTSGFLTQEALDELGIYLDAINLELRAVEDQAHQRLTGTTNWRGILEVIQHAHQRWDIHIEITTRLHPGVNDSIEHIQSMAHWINQTLGSLTPWHILPGDAGSAASATVNRARRLAREIGLQFVYGPEPNQNTFCPQCGALLIERTNGVGRLSNYDQGCLSCGMPLGFRTSIFKARN